MSPNYWLILEKSDNTRISKSIEGYKDLTGESYHYDSLVPNHKNVIQNDFVVLRKENEIFGIGSIADITQENDVKIHNRCPDCGSTDIRERTTKRPKWKCGKCAHEFIDPEETIVEVQSFVAKIENFSQLSSPPTVKEVKLCAAKGNGMSSQLSILRLNSSKIRTLLEGIILSPPSGRSMAENAGQGFGLSQPERKAVELRAMKVTRDFYESAGWVVVDESNSRPFDLLATKKKEQRFIEVKGTTGTGQSVILTHGEIEHVRNHRQSSVLAVVSQIHLEKSGKKWIALNGSITTHYDPWIINDSDLKGTQYRYTIK